MEQPPRKWINIWPNEWHLYEGEEHEAVIIATVQKLPDGSWRYVYRRDRQGLVWQHAPSLSAAQVAIADILRREG
jgi:hypothetical protein